MHKLVVVLTLVGAVAYADSKVSFGTPTVKGALDAKTLETTVKNNAALQSALRECITNAKLGTRENATAKLTIAADGKLTTAATGTGIAALDTCVASAFAALAFDKPKDGKPVEAVVPVTLTPKVVLMIEALEKIRTTQNRLEGNPNFAGIVTTGAGGTGKGYGGMRQRRTEVPRVTVLPPKVKGNLDKAIIRRYIKRNFMKLQYCYEKELVRKPKLEGTITASFVIDVEGNVSSSTAKGLEDGAEVERCYSNVIEAIRFPRPKSGEVSVVYPFALRPK